MTDTLFGPTKRRARWTGSRALVLVGHVSCPTCGAPVVDDVVAEQLPLLRHGGYGATRVTRRVFCSAPACPWALVTEVSETRPPR